MFLIQNDFFYYVIKNCTFDFVVLSPNFFYSTYFFIIYFYIFSLFLSRLFSNLFCLCWLIFFSSSFFSQIAVKNKNSYMIRFLWDIFLHRNTPSLLPILGIALTTVTPFFTVYYLNFHYYNLFIICFLFFIFEKFTLPTFITSKTGLAWGIILTAEYSYYINVRQYYGMFLNCFVLFIGISICYTLLKSTMTKANFLSLDRDR